MLNKPKYMTPSTKTTDCTVDMDLDEVLFTCEIDGNDSVVAWQILVYTLVDNSLMMDTGIQKLDMPFYPVDSNNKNVVFSVNIKDYIPSETQYYIASKYDKSKTYYYYEMRDSESPKEDENGNYIYHEYTKEWSKPVTVSGSPIFYIGELINSTQTYYWVINLWGESETTYTDAGEIDSAPTVCSGETVFYANTSPALNIEYGIKSIDKNGKESITYHPLKDGTVFENSSCYFKASYEQAENIRLKRYGWRIKDVNTSTVLVDTISNKQIYGTARNIICNYSGLLNDGNYSVELCVETQNNFKKITAPICFSVVYDTTYMTSDFSVSALSKEPSVLLDWRNANIICGQSEGEPLEWLPYYPIVNYSYDEPVTSVKIPDSSSVIFDYAATSEIDIAEESSVVLSFQLEDSKRKVLLSLEGVSEKGFSIFRELSFNGNGFEYRITDSNGDLKCISTKRYTPDKHKWYIAILNPYDKTSAAKTLKITESIGVGALYPGEKLYPSNSLYPTIGVWEESENGGN